MARIIFGDGPLPNRLMIVSERAHFEDYEQERILVGPPGQELWARVWRVLRLARSDFYVTALVKTAGMDAPTAVEIAAFAPRLKAEIARCKPELILAVGYHAARWFLPQFADVSGDFFHGLAFPFAYGKLQPRQCTVIPIVSPAAALTQPDRYQNALTNDLTAVREFLKRERSYHQPHRPRVYEVGLASFGKPDQVLGCDTEGSVDAPECVTIARGGVHGMEVACLETWEHGNVYPFMHESLRHAKTIALHYALHDLKVLRRLMRIDDLAPVHDTMMQAYLLDLPQSLKVLAYRELGYEMSEYLDLVTPMDAAQVKATLEHKARIWQEEHEALQRRAERIETKKAAAEKKKRVTKKAIAARYKKLQARHADTLPPMRVVSGILRMIARTEDTHAGPEE